MLSRSISIIALLFSLSVLPGCLFASFKTPLDTDLNRTELGTKTGEASYQGILWLVAFGDAGTQAAAEDGDIKVIRHADVHMLSVLFGLYFKRTTIVYGD